MALVRPRFRAAPTWGIVWDCGYQCISSKANPQSEYVKSLSGRKEAGGATWVFVRLYHACCALLLAALAHPLLRRRHLACSRLRLLLHCEALIDVDSNTEYNKSNWWLSCVSCSYCSGQRLDCSACLPYHTLSPRLEAWFSTTGNNMFTCEPLHLYYGSSALQTPDHYHRAWECQAVCVIITISPKAVNNNRSTLEQVLVAINMFLCRGKN